MRKKIFTLCTLALSVAAIAQQKETSDVSKEGITISAMGGYSEPMFYGLSFEKESELKAAKRNTSVIFAVYMTDLEYKNSLFDENGKGFGIDLGTRTYLQRGKKNGFYSQSYLSYSQTRFNNHLPGAGDGKYSYWSLINGDFGYKIDVGSGISLDVFAGYNWKWEVKGKNGVDNKDFDNFVFRAGFKAGYRF
ncbi:hypothetical protein [Avrilella dinanensis]|uniref:hypothetical protein n=1 Tax=Avrilella dinanensis TaxID=2008672 RepID=UPI00240A59E9|nr:hypothetical protein [Avrilella dinanensis]